MEMEQRVGRIHRYGSFDTVLVDTLVLKDSRELRVLDRSRARLGRIVRDLDRDRFELLFSRTMALIPLDQLAGLMAGENFGELSPTDEERIDQLITAGYQNWKERDAEFRSRAEHLNSLERGSASDDDLLAFITGALGATREEGWALQRLDEDEATGKTVSVKEEATVLRLSDGSLGYVGQLKGITMVGGVSGKPRRLGLNVPSVANQLRTVVGGGVISAKSEHSLVYGAGSVLVHAPDWERFLSENAVDIRPSGGTVFTAYLVRHLEADTRVREVGTTFHAFLATRTGGDRQALSSAAAASLIRLLRSPRAKRTPPAGLDSRILLEQETAVIGDLQKRDRGEPLHAVFPIAAIWIEPTEAPAAASISR
jgi:hypothetical protein